MTAVWTTLKRELVSYLFSPVGYLIAVLLYLLRGVEVSSVLKRIAYLGGDVDQLAAAYVLQFSSLLMIAFVPPILTMRSFAEERRTGSIEVLLTAPVRSWEVVVGKWAAASVFFGLLWAPALPLLWFLTTDSYLAAEVPFATVVSGYVGVALVGSLVLAVGCFTSSLTDNVLLAVLSSMLFGVALVGGYPILLPHVAPYFGEHPWLATLLSQLNVFDQLQNGFARGLIDTRHVVFYVAGTACFLFLTERALEFRRLPRFAGRAVLVLAALIGVVIWAGTTVLGARPAVRALVDLSPQANFTFSPETVELLEDLRNRGIELEFDTFYARLVPPGENPAHRREYQIRQRVQALTVDLLRLYERYGGDLVRVTNHDEMLGGQEARAKYTEYGVQQRNVVVVKVGKRHRELSLDFDLAAIEFPATRRTPVPGEAQRMPRLELYKGEEAISSAIRSMLVEGTPRVYFLTGFGDVTTEAGVASSYSELRGALHDEGFETAEWPLRQKGYLPEDADVIALLEPAYDLSDRDAELMLDYLRRGGRMFVNVSYRDVPFEHNPTLAELGTLCGFEIGEQLVAHLIRDERMPNSPGRGGPGAQTMQTALNPRHPITQPLVRNNRSVRMHVTREIRSPDVLPEGVRVDLSLIRTPGRWAWLAPRTGPGGEADLAAPQQLDAYADRCLGAIVDVDPSEGTRAGQIVLVGGIAFLNGGGFRENADFALNAFNWLAMRRELVTVRGRRYESRRLEVVPQQIERVDRLLLRWVPGLLLALALVVRWWRRRI